MKGLNLIILLLSDLSLLGANDVQHVLPGEFIFISRPLPPSMFGKASCIPQRPGSRGFALSFIRYYTVCKKRETNPSGYTPRRRLRG